MKFRRTLAVAALVLAGAACTTETKTTNAWRDPGYAGGALTSVLVFGGGVDASNRRTLEDHLASTFNERGVRATQSYTMYPSTLPTAEVARDAALKAGIDGLVVSRLKRVKEEQTYVPGSPGPTTYWGGYYSPGWNTGEIVTDEIVLFETTVWDAKSGKMIWSASTETTNPTSGKDFATSLTKEVASGLEAARLVGTPRKD